MPKKEPDGWPRKQGNSKTNSRTTSSSTSHQHPTSFNKVIEDRWRVLGIWEMLWIPLGMEPIHLKWSKILLALWQGQVPFDRPSVDRPSVRMGVFTFAHILFCSLQFSVPWESLRQLTIFGLTWLFAEEWVLLRLTHVGLPWAQGALLAYYLICNCAVMCSVLPLL